jgi:PST family polysaccharide transporter
MINSAFQVGLAGLALVRRVGVAAFLTRAEFGTWGIILAALITLAWLKQVGIGDKYIQQSEPDQELAFQKAFTLELLVSMAYFVVCLIALPAYALAYGHAEIIVPGLVLATSVPLTAFETPSWIPYRQMQYARQRTLISVDPVVSVVVTLALAAAGLGVWGLVLGAVAGSVAGAAVCVVTCPYRLRLRFERNTAREYVSFSWPLLGLGLSRLLVVQGSLLVATRTVGLAGVGAIALATSFATFADRIDGIVTQTIYPAVCSVADRAERLAEVFEKSNRIALMWAMPFAAGLALFAGDLVHYVLGDHWRPAVGLLAAVGLICGFDQVAFNWGAFMRATNRTRPLFIASLVDVGVFLAVSLPAIVVLGLPGYAIGFAAATAMQILIRSYYLHSLFSGFSVARQAVRAALPVVPAAAFVLTMRALAGGQRSLALTLVELAGYAITAIACTYIFERTLITELAGYLRGKVRASAPTVAAGV